MPGKPFLFVAGGATMTLLALLTWGIIVLLVAGTQSDQQWHPMPHPYDTWPSWSPCGERVVFATDRGPLGVSTIYELVLETGRIRPLAPWLAGADEPGYSSDGTKVVCSVWPCAAVVDLRTDTVSNLNRTPDRGDVAFYPTFRGDDHVLFMRQPRDHPRNCIFELTLGQDLSPQARRVLIKDDSYHLRRSVSTRDGSRIAYTRIVDGASRGGRTDICVWDSETEESTTVFVSPHPVVRLSWFPDNSRLLVSTGGSARPEYPRFYILDTEEKQLVPLAAPLDWEYHVASELDISSDGEWLLYTKKSPSVPTSGDFAVTIWKSRLDGSEETELTHLPEWYEARFPDQEPIRGYDKVFGDPEYDPNARYQRE